MASKPDVAGDGQFGPARIPRRPDDRRRPGESTRERPDDDLMVRRGADPGLRCFRKDGTPQPGAS